MLFQIFIKQDENECFTSCKYKILKKIFLFCNRHSNQKGTSSSAPDEFVLVNDEPNASCAEGEGN